MSVVNDPRYELARQMVAQKATAQTRGSRAVNDTGLVDTRSAAVRKAGKKLSAAQSRAKMAGLSAEEINKISEGGGGGVGSPGGVKGMMYSALSSPVGKNVLMPTANALGYLGRSVVSTMREIGDAVDQNPATRASLAQWGSQNLDPTFGWGTAFPAKTGNKWLDRGFGFTGDVITDPVNYLTFGAASAVRGVGGRIATAKRYLDLVDNGLIAADKEVATQIAGRISKEGTGFLDDTTREALGLRPSGVYIGLGEAKGRLPGTAEVGRTLETGLNKARVGLFQRPWMRKATSGFVPASVRGARLGLMMGDFTDAEQVRNALNTVTGASRNRLAKAQSDLQFRKLGHDAVSINGDRWAKSDAGEVMRILEDGVAGTPEAERAAASARNFFDAVANTVERSRTELAPGAVIPRRQNYFPRVWSRHGRRWVANNSEEAKKLFRITEHELSSNPHFDARSMEVGDVWFGHTLTADDLRSTSKLNDYARPYINGDFFETNIARVIDDYAEKAAKEMGDLEHLRFMRDNGTGELFGVKFKPDGTYDEFLQAKRYAAVARTTASYEEALDALKQFKDVGETLLRNRSQQIDGFVSMPETIEQLQSNLDALTTAFADASDDLRRISGISDDGVPGSSPIYDSPEYKQLLDELRTQMDELDSKRAQLEQIQITKEQDIARYDEVVRLSNEAGEALGGIKQKIASAESKAKSFNEAYRAVVEGRGTSTTLLRKEHVGELREAMFGGGAAALKSRRAARSGSMIGGSKWFQSVWKGLLSSESEVAARDAVRALNGEEFGTIVNGAVAGTQSMYDMSRAGAFLLGAAEHLGLSDNITVEAMNELLGALQQSKQSMSYFRKLVSKSGRKPGVAEGSVESLYKQMDALARQEDEVRARVHEIQNSISDNKHQRDILNTLIRDEKEIASRAGRKAKGINQLYAERDVVHAALNDLEAELKLTVKGGRNAAGEIVDGLEPLRARQLELRERIIDLETLAGDNKLTTDTAVSTATEKKAGKQMVGKQNMSIARAGMDESRNRLALALEGMYTTLQVRARFSDLQSLAREHNLAIDEDALVDIINTVFRERADEIDNADFAISKQIATMRALASDVEENGLDFVKNPEFLAAYGSALEQTLLSAEVKNPLAISDVQVWGKEAIKRLQPATTKIRDRGFGPRFAAGGEKMQALTILFDELQRASSALASIKREYKSVVEEVESIGSVSLDDFMEKVGRDSAELSTFTDDFESEVISEIDGINISSSLQDINAEYAVASEFVAAKNEVIQSQIALVRFAKENFPEFKGLPTDVRSVRSSVAKVKRMLNSSATNATENMTNLVAKEQSKAALLSRVNEIVNLYEEQSRLLRNIRKQYINQTGLRSKYFPVGQEKTLSLSSSFDRRLVNYATMAQQMDAPTKRMLNSMASMVDFPERYTDTLKTIAYTMNTELGDFVKRKGTAQTFAEQLGVSVDKIKETVSMTRALDKAKKVKAAIVAESDEDAMQLFKESGYSSNPKGSFFKVFSKGREVLKRIREIESDVMYREALDARRRWEELQRWSRFVPQDDLIYHNFDFILGNNGKTLNFTQQEWADVFLNRPQIEQMTDGLNGAAKASRQASLRQRHEKAIVKFDRLLDAIEKKSRDTQEIFVAKLYDGQFATADTAEGALAELAQSARRVGADGGDAGSRVVTISLKIGGENFEDLPTAIPSFSHGTSRAASFLKSIMNVDDSMVHPSIIKHNTFGQRSASPVNMTQLMSDVRVKSANLESAQNRYVMAMQEQGLEMNAKNTMVEGSEQELRRLKRLYHKKTWDAFTARNEAQRASDIANGRLRKFNIFLDVQTETLRQRLASVDSAWADSAEKAILDELDGLRASPDYKAVFGATADSLDGQIRTQTEALSKMYPVDEVRKVVDAYAAVVGDAKKAEMLLGGREGIKQLLKRGANKLEEGIVVLDNNFNRIGAVPAVPKDATNIEYIKALFEIAGIGGRKMSVQNIQEAMVRLKPLEDLFETISFAVRRAKDVSAEDVAKIQAARAAAKSTEPIFEVAPELRLQLKDAEVAAMKTKTVRDAAKKVRDVKYGITKDVVAGGKRYKTIQPKSKAGIAKQNLKSKIRNLEKEIAKTEVDIRNFPKQAGYEQMGAEWTAQEAVRTAADRLFDAQVRFTYASTYMPDTPLTRGLRASAEAEKQKIAQALDVLANGIPRQIGARTPRDKVVQTIDNMMMLYDTFKTTNLVTRESDPELFQLVEDFGFKLDALNRSVRIQGGVDRMMKRAKAGNWHGELVSEMRRGFKEVSNLKGYGIPEEVEGWFKQFAQLDPSKFNTFGRIVGEYTKFFKAYATLSVGFHVRNAMSNTFMLVASGSNIDTIYNAHKWYFQNIAYDHLNGARAVPHPMAVDAWNVALASGAGGRVSEMQRFFSNSRLAGALSENRLIRFSMNVGGNVEGAAKFALALDSLEKGLNFDQALARVNRYLFDYVDVGTSDEAIRRWIPFWMFMSRNLPLQLANQWANPKAYNIYNDFVNNFRDEDENDIVPMYMRENGAFRIGGSTYVMPDFGFNRLQSDVAMLSDPMRLASNVNPLFRVPIELAGSRKLYSGQDFYDSPQEVTGRYVPFMPLFEALGQTVTKDGRTFVKNEKPLYAAANLMPSLAQFNRLVPMFDSDAGALSGQAVANWFGAPVKQITDRQKVAELNRQTRMVTNKADLEEELLRIVGGE